MKKSLAIICAGIIGLLLVLMAGAEPQKKTTPKKPHKLNVTVYPFKAAGTSEATAVALTSIVLNQLASSEKYQVIEEANLKDILDQQGLSQSGACNDSECQIKIGQLLNSQKFVKGDITKIGKRYIITMKVVN